jgi:hypothetical protein
MKVKKKKLVANRSDVRSERSNSAWRLCDLSIVLSLLKTVFQLQIMHSVGGSGGVIMNWMDKDCRRGFLDHFRKILHGRGEHTMGIRQIADNVAETGPAIHLEHT